MFGQIIGGLLGGLLGGSDSQASSSREPWAPAQPWLKDNITRGQALQNFYQQNPFGPQQKVAYQNLFGDIDNFRNAMLPAVFSKSSMFKGLLDDTGGFKSTPGAGGYTWNRGQTFGPIDWSYYENMGKLQQDAVDKQNKPAESLLTDQETFDRMYREYLQRQADMSTGA